MEQGCLGYWRWRRPWFSRDISTATCLDEVTIYDYLAREVATARSRFYIHARSPLNPADIQRAFSSLSFTDFMNWLVNDLAFNPQHPGEHINWWDEDKVIGLLTAAGFRTIYASRRGQSLFPPMTNVRLFDTTQPSNSLYVEAIK